MSGAKRMRRIVVTVASKNNNSDAEGSFSNVKVLNICPNCEMRLLKFSPKPS